MSKTCRRCGETQPLSAFSADSRYRGGYKHQCKPCVNGYSVAYRAAQPKPAPMPAKPSPPPEVLAERAVRRREYQREWRRKWRAENPERAREEWRKYQSASSDFLTAWRNQ